MADQDPARDPSGTGHESQGGGNAESGHDHAPQSEQSAVRGDDDLAERLRVDPDRGDVKG